MKLSTSVYQAFEAQLVEQLCNPSTLYVGYSGGLDSSCLLHMAWQFCQTHPQHTLQAIHIQHGLQQASKSWQTQCKRTCDARAIPYMCINVSTRIANRGNLEANARKARWQAFETVINQNGVLLLGHHLDDQIETFFLRILRASGLQGMRAICRFKRHKHFFVLRPLLDFKKSDLEHYAKKQNLAWNEDPSNHSNSFDRNWLRNEWLPLLQTRWPNYHKPLQKMHKNIANDYNALHASIADLLTNAMHTMMQKEAIHIDTLQQYTIDQQKAMLRQWLAHQGWYNPSSDKLEHFLLQLKKHHKDKKPTLSTAEWTMLAQRGHVYLLCQKLLCASAHTHRVYPTTTCSAETSAWSLQWQWRSPTTKHQLLRPSLGITTTPHPWLTSIKHSTKRYKKLMQHHQIPAWSRPIAPHLFLMEDHRPSRLLGIGPLAFTDAANPLITWDFRWKR